MKDVLYATAEMDLSGLGNAVFVNFLMFCSEDVGPAEPQLIVEIYQEYTRWKAILKAAGKKPSESSDSKKARACLMKAAYMMARAHKSRVVDYAMHNFQPKECPDVTVE